MLDYAETAVDVNSKEYSEVSDLFQRMLRGYECGKPLKPIEWKLARGIFPVLPADDLEMGVWTNEETLRVLRFIRALLNKAKPNFRRPPGEIGIAVETDAEWNEWVYLMLRQLLFIIELPFERLKIVSFIG